jgi:hypothetical protein
MTNTADGWSYYTWTAKVPNLRQLDVGLNALGAEGWELVTSMSTVKSWVNLSGNDIVMTFKKPGAGQRPTIATMNTILGTDPEAAAY